MKYYFITDRTLCWDDRGVCLISYKRLSTVYSNCDDSLVVSNKFTLMISGRITPYRHFL